MVKITCLHIYPPLPQEDAIISGEESVDEDILDTMNTNHKIIKQKALLRWVMVESIWRVVIVYYVISLWSQNHVASIEYAQYIQPTIRIFEGTWKKNNWAIFLFSHWKM